MSLGATLLWAADAVVVLVLGYKWLRVAQREHYEPGRVTSTGRLWGRVDHRSYLLAILALGALLTGLAGGWWSVASACGLLLSLLVPLGLGYRPTSGPLASTWRLRRVASTLLVLDALVFAAVAVLVDRDRAPALAALAAPLSAPLTDLALLLLAPVERRMSRRFVVSATARLARVRPTVIAITGSYGKTTTKNYAAHLIGGNRSVAASPASFNNLMGLSRAVNERLPEGTEVFVAEMGTYGPGEIRQLCETFPPDVAAIVTIGEAHLERMKNRATIVRAKSEITERAPTVVLNVDVPELARLADDLTATKRVIRCTTRAGVPADVSVTDQGGTWSVVACGQALGGLPAPPTGHPANLSIAVGLALAVDVPTAGIGRALAALPVAPHRAEISTTADGVVIIDDTYNANPDGAGQALRAARELAPGGRVFTVTPGMIELGSRQAEANRTLGRDATGAGMVLAVVGRTNRDALLAGAQGRPGRVQVYPSRRAAASVVLAEARAGDVILYENDLPDHYP